MTREEHLAWAKARALKYVEAGDPENAFQSMIKSLIEHDDLKNHVGIQLGMMLKLGGRLSSLSEIRGWIEGFN